MKRYLVKRTVEEFFEIDAENAEAAKLAITGMEPERRKFGGIRTRVMLICQKCGCKSNQIVCQEGIMVGQCCRTNANVEPPSERKANVQ
jgi:hypothetical protein